MRTLTAITLALTSAITSAQSTPQPDPENQRTNRAELLADAASRKPFADFKPHPFRIAGPNDSYFQLGGEIQFRYAATRRDDNIPGDTDTYVAGFEMRRARLRFAANVPEHRFDAVLQGQFSPSGGQLGLLDAWVRHEPVENWKIRAGQFLLPFDREVMTSNARRLGTEQSIVGQAVGASTGSGRVQGLELTHTTDTRRTYFSINDGIRSNNSPAFSATGTQTTADIALTARIEHLAWGDFGAFKEMYAVPGETGGLMLGAAVYAERRELDTDNDAQFDDNIIDTRATLDLSYEDDGFNAYVALFGLRQTTQNAPDITRLGALVQAGTFIDDDTQVFARYEFASDNNQSEDLSAISFGINEFLAGASLRFTTEIFYFFDPVTDAFDDPTRNVLIDTPDQSGQTVLRAQLQFLF